MAYEVKGIVLREEIVLPLRAADPRPAAEPAADPAIVARRRASIVALAESLDGPDPAAAGTALAAAVATGALVGRGEGALTPTVAVDAEGLPAALRPWLARGFMPFRSKPLACPDAHRPALALLIDAATRTPALHCPPHWVVGDRILTLELPGAVDLRQVLAASPGAGRDWVHEACLRSMEAFAAHDDRLTAVLADRGMPPPEVFPVAERYVAARARLSRILGPLDLPATLPAPRSPGPLTLFSDPKPANFILPAAMSGVMPTAMAESGPADGRPMRIDLDLLRYVCPVSLQVVIALCTYPIALPERGPGGTGFTGLLHDVREAGLRFGAEPDETEAMLLYHLIRNFTSAADESDRGSVAGARKAAALAPVLGTALVSLPSVPPAPATAELLASWCSAHGGHDERIMD
ncbi:hypothetical protein ACWGLF_41915 [Streptomyces puniciscabiei]